MSDVDDDDVGDFEETESSIALEDFLLSVCELVDESMVSTEDSDALDFVFNCADELVRLDKMDPIPDLSASDGEIAEWLASAALIDFVGYVLDKVAIENSPPKDSEF